MKKRYLNSIKAITMVIFFTISLCAYAQIPAFNRLSTCNSGSNSSVVGGTYNRLTYHYDPLNPALLISQTSVYANYDTEEQSQEIACDSSYELIDGSLRIITDYSIAGIPTQRVSNLIDQSGRFIHHRLELWQSTQNIYYLGTEIYRHYDSSGYADSIHVISGNGPGYQSHEYLKRYFDGDTLSHSILYSGAPGTWSPSKMYSFTYPPVPIVLPGFIRFDSAASQQEFISLFYFEQFCNPKVIPASISTMTWYGGQWITLPHESRGQSIQNGIVKTSYYRPAMEDPQSYYRDCKSYLSGYIQESTTTISYADGGGTTGVAFTWCDPVANEDYYIPVPQDLISLYPNPFSGVLNIAIDGKSGPAEISIFNTRGQLIRSWRNMDSSILQWDGKDAQGFSSPRGIYFIKLRLGKETFIRKVLRN